MHHVLFKTQFPGLVMLTFSWGTQTNKEYIRRKLYNTSEDKSFRQKKKSIRRTRSGDGVLREGLTKKLWQEPRLEACRHA